MILVGAYNCWRNYNSKFIWGAWVSKESLFTLIMACLLFVSVMNIRINHISFKMQRVLGSLSKLCYGAFLISYVFDKHFYGILIEKVPITNQRFVHFWLVPLVWLCSLLCSFIIEKIYKVIEMGVRKMSSFVRK